MKSRALVLLEGGRGMEDITNTLGVFPAFYDKRIGRYFDEYQTGRKWGWWGYRWHCSLLWASSKRFGGGD